MNVFITAGTYDYLMKIKQAQVNEQMLLMMHDDQALLLHETEGETVFKEPRSFKVIDAVGTIHAARFVVMNNIPVTDEGRSLFEHRFKNRDGSIEKMPGFVGIRVLRPLTSDTYVIVTLWKDESDFNRWKNSEAFGKSHQKPALAPTPSGDGGLPPKKLFSAASYVTKYYIPEEE